MAKLEQEVLSDGQGFQEHLHVCSQKHRAANAPSRQCPFSPDQVLPPRAPPRVPVEAPRASARTWRFKPTMPKETLCDAGAAGEGIHWGGR